MQAGPRARVRPDNDHDSGRMQGAPLTRAGGVCWWPGALPPAISGLQHMQICFALARILLLSPCLASSNTYHTRYCDLLSDMMCDISRMIAWLKCACRRCGRRAVAWRTRYLALQWIPAAGAATARCVPMRWCVPQPPAFVMCVIADG